MRERLLHFIEFFELNRRTCSAAWLDAFGFPVTVKPMKDRIKGWIQKGADKALGSEFVRSKLIDAVNASKLNRYGTVIELEVQVESRRLGLAVLLHGESSPVNVAVERFALLGDEPKARVRFDEVRVDRVWLQNAINDHIIGREFNVPANQGKWVQRLRELWS
jgi:hypothetical protein